jgi:signal transduction histidine kinase
VEGQKLHTIKHVKRAQIFAWSIIALSGGLMFIGLQTLTTPFPSISTIIFWVALLLGAELLPVSLGFHSQVTMSFPLVLALAIVFEPGIAMPITVLGAFDAREIKREIPLWHALFNRAQLALAAGAASFVIVERGQDSFVFPQGSFRIALAACIYIFMNLGLVGLGLHFLREVPLGVAFKNLVPSPAAGFWFSQALLAALGAATAAAYEEVGAFVAAFLIPLLFARLGLLGARAQQELSERLRQQQAALLKATEQVFKEREDERKRIAGEIHDGSLQMLAAASYNVGNAGAFLDAGRREEAAQLLDSSRKAIEQSMAALRDSLVDLRRSSVEEGGLLETIRVFVGQVSMLWGTEIEFEGEVKHEPPVPIALAGFQILQEGLTNALKHANSTPITVRVADIDNMVHIIVEDDGPGFDPAAESASGHVGMKLMHERADLVGGSIEFHSRPGGGTRLEAKLPGGMAE